MNAIFRGDRYTAMVCNIFEAIVSWQLGLCVHAACDTPGYMDQDLCGNHWCMERATMHCDSCMKTAFCSQECAVLAAGLLPCLRRQEPEFTFNIAATLGISYCVVSPKFVTATFDRSIVNVHAMALRMLLSLPVLACYTDMEFW
jgi:hypothetical protein